jgi:hypothetical protein
MQFPRAKSWTILSTQKSVHELHLKSLIVLVFNAHYKAWFKYL